MYTYAVLCYAPDCLGFTLGYIGVLKLKALKNLGQSFAEFTSVKHLIL